MTFEQFFDAVDNMVERWKPDDAQAGATPREALRRIYDDVSEQAVHRLAEAMQQRDAAIAALHKQLVTYQPRKLKR